MPQYNYRCTECSCLFYEVQSIKDYIADISNRKTCPRCGKKMQPSRVIGYPLAIIYRDDGFTLRKKENEPS
jgi:putative FmdB family regulatory protein